MRCPHCGRCHECGQPAPQPVFTPVVPQGTPVVPQGPIWIAPIHPWTPPPFTVTW